MELQPYNGPGGGSGNLQNTIDWGLVSKATISVSLDILSRYSSANVDPLTVAIGQHLCDHWFDHSATGRRNVTDALGALPCNSVFGDYLWMGFGTRHIVRTMSQTSQGTIFVALCGVLSEFFREDIAAEILHEMVKSINAPSHLRPSISQWKSLLQACAGVLSHSNFGTLVEELIQQNPAYWSTENTSWFDKEDSMRLPSAQSTEEALRAIGDISKGRMDEITIVGGFAVGWFAAVADWMFGLSITIQDAKGAVLYRNCEKFKPKIIFLYKDISSTLNGEGLERQVQCIGRTYILENAQDLFREDILVAGFASGRLAWSTIFTRIFGSTFERLLANESLTFGTAIGNAARILHAIAHGEDTIPPKLIAKWTLYRSTTYGRGFLAFVTSRFPELDSLRATMEAACSVPLDEAKRSYQNQMTKLKYTCETRGCTVCTNSPGVLPTSNVEKICNVIMVETIIGLASILSATIVAEGLYPKALGLMILYDSQVKEHEQQQLKVEFTTMFQNGLGPFERLFPTRRGLEYGRCRSEVYQPLFSGTKSRHSDSSATASAYAGVCIYSGILSKSAIETYDLEQLSTTYVCAGNIEYDGKPFAKVEDLTKGLDTFTNLETPIPRDLLEPDSKVKVKAKEAVDSVQVCYQLIPPDADPGKIVRLLPGASMNNLDCARGWIRCSTRGCKPVCEEPLRNDGSFEVAGVRFTRLPDVPIYKCAVVANPNTNSNIGLVVCQSGCVQCSIRYALSGRYESYHRRLGEEENRRRTEWIII